VGLFQATGISRELVFLFCGPLALAFFFNGTLFVSNAAFNNLGHPYYSTWVNWGRHTVGTIPLVILFASWFGAAGVLIGQAAGGMIFGLISVWLALRVMDKSKDGNVPVVEPFSRQARLMALFHHRR
jgi:Na+-driven multidrug efflux pump